MMMMSILDMRFDDVNHEISIFSDDDNNIKYFLWTNLGKMTKKEKTFPNVCCLIFVQTTEDITRDVFHNGFHQN